LKKVGGDGRGKASSGEILKRAEPSLTICGSSPEDNVLGTIAVTGSRALPLKIPLKGLCPLRNPASFSSGLRAAYGGWPMDAPAGAMKKAGPKTFPGLRPLTAGECGQTENSCQNFTDLL